MGRMRGAALATGDEPAAFQFITVDDTRLRYLDMGTGTPVVLLHGNGSMIEDFLSSGVMDAPDHRFIAFDRPGFGHSDRPHDRVWSPWEQARLFLRALAASRSRAADRRRPLLGVAGGLGDGAAEPRGRGGARAAVGILLSDTARGDPSWRRRVPLHARRPSPHGHPFRASPHGAGHGAARVCALRGPREVQAGLSAAARPADIADAGRRRGSGDAAGFGQGALPAL